MYSYIIKGALLLTVANATQALYGQSNRALELRTLDGNSITTSVMQKNGFYKVPPVANEGFYTASRMEPVYLAPGFSLEIKPQEKRYLFKGKGSRHNQVLDSISLLADQYFEPLQEEFWKYDPDNFLKLLSKYKEHVTGLVHSVKGSSLYTRVANAELQSIIQILAGSYAYEYGLEPEKMKIVNELIDRKASSDSFNLAMKEARKFDLPADKRKLLDSMGKIEVNLEDEELLRNSVAFRRAYDIQIQIAGMKIPRTGRMTPQELQNRKLDFVMQEVKNPFIREYYTFQQSIHLMKTNQDPSQLDSAYEAYMQKAKHEKFRASIQKVYTKRKAFMKGAASPEFNFADTAGNKVSLQSLRGKYVYIDLWATWCGPCKAEIPHLKELEKKFHGRNIVFVSISIDELHQKQKWIDFVRKEQLGGIQLMADRAWETEFVKDYTIVGIPHFILLGPQGEIIESSAKRPSQPELAEQLQRLLQN